MTPTTPPALIHYRSRHRIKPVRDWDDSFKYFALVCETDAIRVYPVRGGFRHDPSEIKDLAARERGEKVPW